MNGLAKVVAIGLAIIVHCYFDSGFVQAQTGTPRDAVDDWLETNLYGGPQYAGGSTNMGGSESSSRGVGFGSFPVTTQPFAAPATNLSNYGRAYGATRNPDLTDGPTFGGNSPLIARTGARLGARINPLNSGIARQERRPYAFVLGSSIAPHSSATGSHATHTAGTSGHVAGIESHGIHSLTNRSGVGQPPAGRSKLLDMGLHDRSLPIHHGRPYVGATRTYFPGETTYYENRADLPGILHRDAGTNSH